MRGGDVPHAHAYGARLGLMHGQHEAERRPAPVVQQQALAVRPFEFLQLFPHAVERRYDQGQQQQVVQEYFQVFPTLYFFHTSPGGMGLCRQK